ncbi:MAG: glycosyltransferase family 39 protein, partial [Vicinamibacterales bacterium]
MIRRERLNMIACAAWAGVVLGCYYIQLWRAVAERHVPSGRDVFVAVVALLLVAAGMLLAGRSGSRAASPASTRIRRVYWSERAAVTALGAAGAAALPWFVLRPRLVAALAHGGLPHFPFAGEAAVRFIAGLVGASLVGVAIVSAGTVLLRAAGWRAGSRSEHVLFSAVSGVIVLSYGSLLLAVLGIYRPWAVATLIGVLCLAGLPLARSAARMPPETVRTARYADTPWLIVTGLALACAFVAALAPEKEYDALWYHLHLPRLWLESSGPVDVVEEFVSLYPLTWELIFGSGMALGGVVGAKLLHFACLPLLGTLTWHAARRYLPGAPAAAAVVLVVTTPTMLWEAGTAYVDLALALHAAAGCYALVRFWEQDERAWAVVAALQLGTAAATKHLGIFVAVIALALYVAAALRAGRGARRAWPRGLLIGIGAALLPLPWYVRSWLASGNPIFPEMWEFFGAFPAQRWDFISALRLAHFKTHFGIGRSVGDLVALPWDVTVHGALFFGSLGPLFLVLAPGVFLARRHGRALPWLCAGAVCYFALWASPISSYQMRFLMPVVPALALIAAACVDSIAA